MSHISANILCPSCRGSLVPVELACEACGLTVHGHFAQNEFAPLSTEDLHLLRIFVRTEGSIREMEAALGVSYPTVKARILELKQRLGLDQAPPAASPTAGRAAPPAEAGRASADITQLLDELQQGRITPDQAVTDLRRLRKGGSR